jgi:hypothetical protein
LQGTARYRFQGKRVCSRIQVECEGKVSSKIFQGLYRLYKNILIAGKKSGQQNTGWKRKDFIAGYRLNWKVD